MLLIRKKKRESTLAQVESSLTPANIRKTMEQHQEKFDPKLRAYSILQHKVEDVVHESIKIWKREFGLLIAKDEDKGATISKDVEPAKELKVMESPILETEAPKVEEIQKVSEVHIVDIMEDTSIKN